MAGWVPSPFTNLATFSVDALGNWPSHTLLSVPSSLEHDYNSANVFRQRHHFIQLLLIAASVETLQTEPCGEKSQRRGVDLSIMPPHQAMFPLSFHKDQNRQWEKHQLQFLQVEMRPCFGVHQCSLCLDKITHNHTNLYLCQLNLLLLLPADLILRFSFNLGNHGMWLEVV